MAWESRQQERQEKQWLLQQFLALLPQFFLRCLSAVRKEFYAFFLALPGTLAGVHLVPETAFPGVALALETGR